jgi:M6 family metalloprotease-like protein
MSPSVSRRLVPRRAGPAAPVAAVVALAALAALTPAAPSRADYIDHFAAPDDIGILKVPNRGRTRVLVLPVIIEDLPFEQGSEQAFLAELAAFFDPAARGWAFTPFWRTQSLGRFVPEATVASPVRFASCPRLGAYEDCAIPRGAGIAEDPQGAAAVLDDALTFIDEIFRCARTGPAAGLRCTAGGGVDFSEFDTSGIVEGTPDTVVDGVILLSNGGFPGIALPVKELSQNALLQFLGPFPSFQYDGVTVGAVAIAGRARPPQHATWVSVHELGHLLGFADLYDESGQQTDMPYTLMGGWYYQDPGSLLDPFSRIAIGWGHVVQATGPGTFELGPVDRTGTVLKVGTGDEFFLVELRRKVEGATDGDLSVGFGVVVERVRLSRRPDPRRGQYFATLAECVNCRPFDTFLSIEQADARFDLENGRARDDANDLFYAGDEIGPSADTEPRSRAHAVFSTNRLDGAPTGLTIRVLEASAERALIEVDAPPVADACGEIAEWCRGLSCEGGACGEVTPLNHVVILPPAGCTCAGALPLGAPSGAQPFGLALALLAVLRLASARRRRARFTRPGYSARTFTSTEPRVSRPDQVRNQSRM